MTKITFNSKAHVMQIVLEGGVEERTFENVMTIKTNDGLYEILQRQNDGVVAPLFRLPITSTIIEFSHNLYD